MAQRCEDLGERRLVRRVAEILGISERDDCAMVEDGENYLVWTTDMLHRRADFPEIATGWQIGWMAAAVNLSDVAAMGALPTGLLSAAGIPPGTEVEYVEEIFAGMKDCARTFGTRILGGDLDSCDELTLVGTALGRVERDRVLRRRGARPGDLLCTTGTLGGAGAGLRVALEAEGKGIGSDPGLVALTRRLLEPSPRMAEGRALALSGAATSMMDNSDGLVLSLYELAEASGVGFLLQEEKIPIDPLVALIAEDRDDALDLALTAGGDFELIFTLRPEMIGEAARACLLAVIGEVTTEGVRLQSAGGTEDLKPRGYEPMRSPEG